MFEFPPGNLGVNSVPPEVEDGVLNDNGAVLWEKGLFYHFELNKGSLDKVQQGAGWQSKLGHIFWKIGNCLGILPSHNFMRKTIVYRYYVGLVQ